MKYPFHTQSMPVVGYEAQRLISAIEHDDYVTNDAAKATVQRIAERRKARELADVTRR
jgi:hypothetical protein